MDLYLYPHLSGGLTKVGMASSSAAARQADYIATHGLVGFDEGLEVFATGAKSRSELREIERQVHEMLHNVGGQWKAGRTGPQEIFAVSPSVARKIISDVTKGRTRATVLTMLMRRGLVTLGFVGGTVALVWLSYEGWRLWESKKGRKRPALTTVVGRRSRSMTVGLIMLTNTL